MKKSPRAVFIIVVTVVIFGAAAGAIFGERGVPENEQHLILRATHIVTTMMEWLPEETLASDIVYDGIDGMLEVLDPHSNYLDPRTFKTMRTRQEGSFFGIGIIISRRNGKVTVIAPMSGTPAARVGLRAGDIISRINDEETEDMTLTEVVDLVRGPEGSEIRLTMDRPGFSESFDVTITRARIPTNSVQFAFIVNPGVGYIRLSEFSNTSVREVHKAIERLLAEGMTHLVFDLRNNPGGSLDAAIGVTDTFLNERQLIVTTRGRTPESISTIDAPGNGIQFEGPLVVLVNQGSASASEIVAGAVQDHDRGLVLGDVTWGKGLVQTVFTVRDTGLALTTARYYTPSGRCIQRDYGSFIDYITHRNAVSPDDEDAEFFETDAGRTVFGGGSVTPDVTVIADELSQNAVILYGNSAFFRFAIEFLKDIPETEQEEAGRAFEADDEILERFFSWSTEEEILDEDVAAQLREDTDDRRVVARALRVEVINATLGLDEGYKIGIAGDNQFKAAIEHLKEAEEFWEAFQSNS